MPSYLEVASRCEELLDLTGALSSEYYYPSLPLCVIDAVFSVGVRYEGVKNVVQRYCDYYGLQRVRSSRDSLPSISDQESIRAFTAKIEETGLETFTDRVFHNRQRTSVTNGVLKTEASYRFARVLQDFGVEHFQDVPKVLSSDAFERAIRNIPGQTSGISLKYFFMLAGADDLIKPDRMILRFLQTVTGEPLSLDVAQTVLEQVSEILSHKHPQMNPRLLDHLIWNYQRANS